MKLISATLGYKKHPVLKNISLEIIPGEWWFVTGPSGSGKSTLLQTLFGTLPVLSGVLLDSTGRDMSTLSASEMRAYRQTGGMIFQDYQLIEHKTVNENVAYALEISGYTGDIGSKTRELLEYVGISEKSHAFPTSLSGGEKQRVAIARALIHDPAMILADEPTGNLDRENTINILNLLKKLHTSGTTVVMATHDTSLLTEVAQSKRYEIGK